ncbi:MAG: SDR family oxidoreductase [Fimbriimonas sp.]|nr:SDR family oxidoreductase [Fimbriimonas sp.]
MRVFVTGATGFIGAFVVQELLGAGHQVVGLARSEAGAEALVAAGAEAHRGDLEDLDSLRQGASDADGVIHLGFVHDFSRFVEVCEIDRRAIEALGAELSGSNRPLIVTSGTGMGTAIPGRPATEDHFDPSHPHPRAMTEITGNRMLELGVNVMAMRLPQVHNTLKQGLVSYAIRVARQTGSVAYVGEGLNRWPAVHVQDCALLYRLALENGSAGERYHAVGEEGITVKAIAESLSRGLGLPLRSVSAEEAAAQFGPLGGFIATDMPASSAWTQDRMEWHPTGTDLISDLDQAQY